MFYKSKKTYLSIAILPLMVSSIMGAHALEQMDDTALANESGQDGLAINTSMSDASIGRLTWQDGTAGSLVFGSPTGATPEKPITIKPTTAGGKVETNITVQTAANSAGVPAIDLSVGLGKAEIDIPQLSLCDASGQNCDSFGAMSVTNSGTETKFSLITTNGLLSKAGTAKLKAVIDNMTGAIKQTNGGAINQLMLGNMYANMTADGKLFVTNEQGLKFIGTVDFDASTLSGAQREGLEVLVQHKTGTSATKTLGKIALTGSMTDVDLSLRGVQGTVTDLGFDNGTNGIAMRMSANFDEDMKIRLGDKSTLALTKWKKLGGTGVKSFDTGNVYLNIVPSSATVKQTLPVNDRLTKSDNLLSAIETSSGLSRKFVKETGDTNTTPFGTTGKQFVNKNGFVMDNNGNVVKAFDGLRRDYSKGIINKNGDYLSVKTFLKDGYVVEGNDYAIPGSGNGNNGRFKTVFKVDANGSTAGNELYLGEITDTNGGKRPNRQVRVWVNQGDGNIVVAPYGAGNNNSGRKGNNVGGLGNGNHADAYHKAIDLASPNYNPKSGNELANLNYPFRINNNGEVINASGVLLLQRHAFNAQGYLVENPNGNASSNANGTTTGNGDYVYEYTYQLDETNNQLVLTHKITGAVSRIDLAAFDKNALQAVGKDSYSMTTETVSGDGGTSQAGQSISINVRDMSLQGYATKSEFTEKVGSTTRVDTQNWTVAPVLYGVNANMLLFPKKLNTNNAVAGYTQAGDAIGYKLVATTKGSDGDTDFNQANATQTTGILLTHDDATDNTKTRYLGVRHMDSLIRAQGDIQITGEGIAVTAKDFLFAFRGELATGVMPEAGQTFSTDDRLAVLEGKIKGDLSAKIKPVDKGLGFEAKMKFAQGNFGTNTGVRVIMPDGNSSINVGEITGTVAMDGSIGVVNTSTTPASNFDGALNIKGNLQINPDSSATNEMPDQDLRIRNIGFNATPIQDNGTTVLGAFSPYQDTRIGEMAFTKHNIYTDIKIRGVN